MGIDSINRINGFNRGEYIQKEIPKVSVETVKQQDEAKVNSSNNPVQQTVQQREEYNTNLSERAKRVNSLEDISVGFRKQDDFSYIGKDKNLEDMDKQTSVSDGKKDSILMEYRYFVGARDGFSSEDGVVIPK